MPSTKLNFQKFQVIFPEDGYFGTDDKKPDNPAIAPFKINVLNSSLQVISHLSYVSQSLNTSVLKHNGLLMF